MENERWEPTSRLRMNAGKLERWWNRFTKTPPAQAKVDYPGAEWRDGGEWRDIPNKE